MATNGKRLSGTPTWDDLHPEERRARIRRYQQANKEKLAAKQKEYYRTHPSTYLYIIGKMRAKRAGLPFTITKADIVIPELCPVLGIPLARGTRQDHDASPSIDQIVAGRGYVKGNVLVVSHRANRLKGDATLEELRKLVAYLEQFS